MRIYSIKKKNKKNPSSFKKLKWVQRLIKEHMCFSSLTQEKKTNEVTQVRMLWLDWADLRKVVCQIQRRWPVYLGLPSTGRPQSLDGQYLKPVDSGVSNHELAIEFVERTMINAFHNIRKVCKRGRSTLSNWPKTTRSRKWSHFSQFSPSWTFSTQF